MCTVLEYAGKQRPYVLWVCLCGVEIVQVEAGFTQILYPLERGRGDPED